VPEVGIHRGRLHVILYEAARKALGPDAIQLDHDCVGVTQDDAGASVHFSKRESVRGDVVIACDGINSALRKQFYPDDRIAFAGINTWRGVTRRKPIFDGRTYMRVGSILTGKMVIYPIADDVDAQGNQLVNWMAEIKRDTFEQNDWNRPGDLADFFPLYESWRFPWLDVAQMIRDADQILEYPMVDKDPIARWTFGRVTLAGDAAHPMYPRGSNGAAQAAIDARTLADLLASGGDPSAALKAYETARAESAANVVRTNREHPPDFINIKVEELVGDRPFDDLDKFITQEELRALSEHYKRVAGFTLADVAPGGGG
jgi:2-polyprenyl-6-methoxyphenol hydroxylase-like FAD-dependent oxidoreductase